jgi:hypothetical protein
MISAITQDPGGATGSLSCHKAIMGGPDKPGHDDL